MLRWKQALFNQELSDELKYEWPDRVTRVNRAVMLAIRVIMAVSTDIIDSLILTYLICSLFSTATPTVSAH